jgi:peptidoglycan/LPS O-acetylase OafA/YrhL
MMPFGLDAAHGATICGVRMEYHYPVLMILISSLCAFFVVTWVAARLPEIGFPLPGGRGRIGCIDGLRGYLALAVMVTHFTIWLQITRLGGVWEGPTIRFLANLGRGGVALFFMTTGLLFYPKILKGFRAISWPTLFVGRGFRLLPMLILSVAIATGIVILRTGNVFSADYPVAMIKWISGWDEPNLLDYPNSFWLNAGVLWSLGFEWVFYFAILPAAALAIDFKKSSWPTWVVPAALVVAAVAAHSLAKSAIFIRYLPLFGVGMLVFEAQRADRVAIFMRKPIVGLMSLIGLITALCFTDNPYTFGLILYTPFFLCVACGNTFWGVLATKGALVLGECSFGIYLMHGLVLNLLFIDGDRLIANVSTTALPWILVPMFPIVLALTAVLYVVVERNGMKAGAAFVAWFSGRRPDIREQDAEVAP